MEGLKNLRLHFFFQEIWILQLNLIWFDVGFYGLLCLFLRLPNPVPAD